MIFKAGNIFFLLLGSKILKENLWTDKREKFLLYVVNIVKNEKF